MGMQRVARETGITILEQDIMKVYMHSEARRRLADVLNIARTDAVVIKRRSGETFSIIFRKK